jgi:hypothetical protein
MAEDARRMPSRENEYRNLILNQRVDRNSPFISKGSGRQTAGKHRIGAMSRSMPGSISQAPDLDSLRADRAWIDDAWETKPTFWLPDRG